MKRILMVVDHVGANGTVTHVISLSKALKDIGYHMVIAGKAGSKLETIIEYGIPFYTLDFPATFTPTPSQKQKMEKKLGDIIQAENISIVHAHQVYSGMIAARFAAANNLRFMYTVHGLYAHKHELNSIAAYTSALIAVSPYVFSQLQLQFPEKATLILNGVDEKEFYPENYPAFRTVLEIPADHFVVFYASRLEWIKAEICMQLIQAVNQLKNTSMPDLQLVIAGEGRRSSQINETARFYNLNRKENFIRNVGSQSDLREYYGISDCIIGTGRTAIEAMLCGKNVIAAGNKGFFGHVNLENWDNAKYFHFADHFATQPCKKDDFIQSIIELRKENQLSSAKNLERETVILDYSVHKAAQEHASLYLM